MIGPVQFDRIPMIFTEQNLTASINVRWLYLKNIPLGRFDSFVKNASAQPGCSRRDHQLISELNDLAEISNPRVASEFIKLVSDTQIDKNVFTDPKSAITEFPTSHGLLPKTLRNSKGVHSAHRQMFPEDVSSAIAPSRQAPANRKMVVNHRQYAGQPRSQQSILVSSHRRRSPFPAQSQSCGQPTKITNKTAPEDQKVEKDQRGVESEQKTSGLPIKIARVKLADQQRSQKKPGAK
jgi:hypothetical protein